MAIISFVIAMGLPAIERITLQRLNSTTRRFVGIVRTVRNDSILLNNVYRLAIDLEKQRYWVESQREQRLLGQEELEEANNPKKKKKRKRGEPEERPSNFQMAEKFSREPIAMPGGVIFDGVLKEREGLIKEGIAYVHFFPNGYTEQAILYLAKEGSGTTGYSLVIRPTLGKVEIVASRVSDFNTPVGKP